MQKSQPTDNLFEILANPYRRQLLVALLDHNPQDDRDLDPLGVASDEVDPEVLEIELVHTHLPKLADLGYVSWNRDTNEISKGPNWEEIAPLLQLIHDHQDELPDDWL
ncbi:DUF7344 domain-containing protein [Halobaculum rarum]|uniref:DUF7344 domain-containing protein n=1 Tax=Halobaculum rarum TaxID=3075122 RepID=UPI0032AFB2D5